MERDTDVMRAQAAGVRVKHLEHGLLPIGQAAISRRKREERLLRHDGTTFGCSRSQRRWHDRQSQRMSSGLL